MFRKWFVKKKLKKNFNQKKHIYRHTPLSPQVRLTVTLLCNRHSHICKSMNAWSVFVEIVVVVAAVIAFSLLLERSWLFSKIKFKPSAFESYLNFVGRIDFWEWSLGGLGDIHINLLINNQTSICRHI